MARMNNNNDLVEKSISCLRYPEMNSNKIKSNHREAKPCFSQSTNKEGIWEVKMGHMETLPKPVIQKNIFTLVIIVKFGKNQSIQE